MLSLVDRSDELAFDIINTLGGRRGFSAWWESLDEDIQEEIMDEIVTTLEDR